MFIFGGPAFLYNLYYDPYMHFVAEYFRMTTLFTDLEYQVELGDTTSPEFYAYADQLEAAFDGRYTNVEGTQTAEVIGIKYVF